jgi:hypothetical protein
MSIKFSFREIVVSMAYDDAYTEDFMNKQLELHLKMISQLPRQKYLQAINQNTGRVNVRQHLRSGPRSELIWTWIILGLPFYKDGQEHKDFRILDLPDLGSTEGMAFDELSLKSFLQLHKLPLPEYIFGEAENAKRKPVTINVPQGTTWKQIKIRIANDQRVEITYPGNPMEPWKPEEIGFGNKRLLWPLFKQLAMGSGQLKPKDFKPLKANISNIRTLLKELFPTISDGTPIKEYSKENGYVCNFQLSISDHLSDQFMDDEDVKEVSRKKAPSNKAKTAIKDKEYYEKILGQEGLSEDDLRDEEERYEDLMEGIRNER